ncbi:MAG: hypothetical protein EHM47_12905 [Ignavibacteriales bacterium]|nr:MAG: hypothetical protein EHM47_12905 [Ignavibacteriales bacterium]
MTAVYWNRYPNEGLWINSRVDSSQKLLLKGNIFPLRWAKNSREIYAVNSDKTPPEIIKVSANTGLYKVIYIPPSGKIYYIDITPDGETIVSAIRETNSDVWMIENFDPDVE